MSRLAAPARRNNNIEKNEQEDNQTVISKITAESIEYPIQQIRIVRDITREQWFWDKAVMS